MPGAVRTLMKRSNSFKNVDRNIHVNTSVPRSKVRVSGHKTAVDLEHEDDFKQVLSDDNGLATMTVPRVTVQNKDIVGALDFLDVNPPACNQVEIAPFRHVSFAWTVEMVEFDPAVHAVSAPMVEYDAA